MNSKKKPVPSRAVMERALRARGSKSLADVAKDLGLQYHVVYRAHSRMAARAELEPVVEHRDTVEAQQLASELPKPAKDGWRVHQEPPVLTEVSRLRTENLRLRALLRASVGDLGITIASPPALRAVYAAAE